jgi:hypothetical protein
MMKNHWPLVKELKMWIELLNTRLDSRSEEKTHMMTDFPKIKVPAFKVTQSIGFSYI